MASLVVRVFGLVANTFLIASVLCSVQSSDSGVSADNLTGDTISKLGDRLNKPLLMLMGKAFSNYDQKLTVSEENTRILMQEMCKHHQCTEWTSWTACDGIKHEFGGQNRSRTCGIKSTLCPGASQQKPEYETKLCQGRCPDDYTVTTSQFCLKMQISIKRNRTDAEGACVEDGGHLVNIDSAEKHSDIEGLLSTAGITSGTIWIDGLRTTKAGSWIFSYPARDSSYTNWKPGEPSNGSSEYCKVLDYSSGWFWFDRECDKTYSYICEAK